MMARLLQIFSEIYIKSSVYIFCDCDCFLLQIEFDPISSDPAQQTMCECVWIFNSGEKVCEMMSFGCPKTNI